MSEQGLSAPVALLTGGAGFIGCALAARLLSAGYSVVAVDSLLDQVHPSGERPADLPADVTLIVADVREPATWDRVLGELGIRPSLVVHLAAETGTGQSLAQASRHVSVNVLGTSEMTDAFLRYGVVPEHILLPSSRAVYGEGSWIDRDGQRYYPAPRSHQQLERGEWDCASPDGRAGDAAPHRASLTTPVPTSVYGATKLAQENVLRAWCLATGAALSVLRLQNVYGPGQSLTNSYTGIVTLFARLASEGRSIPLYEDGEVQRDFVYIDDVADALAAAVAVVPAGGFRVLDVGSGVTTTILDLANTVCANHPSAPAPHITGQFRDGDVRHASADVQDTVRELAWHPAWPLAKGLDALQSWIQTTAAGTP